MGHQLTELVADPALAHTHKSYTTNKTHLRRALSTAADRIHLSRCGPRALFVVDHLGESLPLVGEQAIGDGFSEFHPVSSLLLLFGMSVSSSSRCLWRLPRTRSGYCARRWRSFQILLPPYAAEARRNRMALSLYSWTPSKVEW